ncbi:MAG TPA: hypothetical protein VFZ44_04820 [Pyrinomonadaceae bacterium]
MKGGITSGVAYPRAVCELARTYSLKSVGGASAGAIAAAAAAAAEYQRRTGTDASGYARLATLPAWLASDGNLGRLFQANEPTRPLYNLLLKSLEVKGGLLRKVFGVFFAACRSFPAWGSAGAAAALILLLLGVWQASRVGVFAAYAAGAGRFMLLGYGILLTLIFVVLGAAVFVAAALVLRVFHGLPANYYGLTTGLLDPEGRGEHPALTTWLADEIDAIAGKSRRAAPLTFGDLWDAVGTLDQTLPPGDDRGVRLQLITTNLTLGRPYRLPFDDESTEYFYDPEEWAKFFPAYVMKWLAEHPRELTETEPKKRERQATEWKSFEPRKPLPSPRDMPVVIAARMSLSFPVLIGAVPLWTVDRSRVLKDKKTGVERPPKLERCVFSDGGISSNFPIHFFDKPLPRWPTFGIDLQNFHPDFPRDPEDESKNSYLVRTNAGGRADVWDRFDDPRRSGRARLTGFFGALIYTVYNWADNSQTRVPGYRDRVVHIFQTKDEGGLNLNMPETAILALAERGRWAGVKLRDRFTGRDGSALTWDNHRWIRYRSTMSLVEGLLRDLRRGAGAPLAGDTIYANLIARGPTDPPPGYRLNEPGQRAYAEFLTRRLLELSDEWEQKSKESGQSFTDGGPRPEPELRFRPRI